MSQTSIIQDPPVSVAGLIADTSPRTIGSHISAEEGPDATGAVLAGTIDETYNVVDGSTLVVTTIIDGVVLVSTLTVDAADVSALATVSLAELIALVVTDLPGITGTDVTGLTLTTDEVGSDVQMFVAAGALATLLGMPTTTATGTDGTPVDLDFGLGVVTNTELDAVDHVRSPEAAAVTNLVFKGVAIFDASKQSALSELAANTADYPAQDVVPVLTKGVIWVNVEGAVDEGDGVFLRVVVSGNEVAGHFAAAADASDMIDVSAFCAWRSRTTGAGLAKLAINLP